MTFFLLGLSLGLLLNRQSKKPLLHFPLRCWFFGHGWQPETRDWQSCARCHLWMDEPRNRFSETFWTI